MHFQSHDIRKKVLPIKTNYELVCSEIFKQQKTLARWIVHPCASVLNLLLTTSFFNK